MNQIFDLQLEQYLLSGILHHPNTFPDIDGFITEADFKNKLHSTIWSVIKRTLRAGEQIDKVIIAQKIDNLALSFEDKISSVADYLEGLTLISAKEESVKLTANELKTVSIRRNIAHTGEEIAEAMYQHTNLDADQVVALSNKIYTKVVNNFKPKNEPVDLFRGAEEYIRSLEDDTPSDEIACPYKTYQSFFGGYFPGDLTLFASAPKSGKALEENTLIPTPTGFIKIKDLKVGDKVFSETGLTTKVLAIKSWQRRPTFKIITNDGQEVIADENHEWLVRPCRRNKKWVILSTKEIYERKFQRPIKLPDYKPLNLPHTNLPIDPYILGVWLGDGNSANARITQSKKDAKHLINQFRERGYLMQKCNYGNLLYKVPNLQTILRKNNLLNNKHIPFQYFRASISQRRDLLKGLIDTDGHVSKNNYGEVEFCTTKSQLADGCLELLHSLGIKSQVKKSIAYLKNKNCGPKFRIIFHANNICSLPRKVKRLNNHIKKPSRFIKKIIPYKKSNTVCIEVDNPTHLFLCGRGMIVTHNSTLLANMMKKICEYKEENIKGLIVDTELETYRVQRRMISAISGVNEYLIKSKKWRKNKTLYEKVEKALEEMKAYFDKIDHIYVGNITTEEMISIVKRWHWKNVDKSKNKAIVAIDYFKLTGTDNITDAFASSMSLGMRVDSFKKLASELQIPIIGAVQTNRSNQVGLSHEVNKFVSSLFLFERKTKEEMERDNFDAIDRENATHKLIPLYTRDLGELAERYNEFVEYTNEKDGKKNHVPNYISFKLQNFNVIEVGDLHELFRIKENKLKFNKEKSSVKEIMLK